MTNYVAKFLEEFKNPSFKEYLKNTFNKKDFFDFSSGFNDVVFNKEILILKNIFEWIVKEKALTKEKIIKNKNKILFSTYKCHYCLFIKLGVSSLVNVDTWNPHKSFTIYQSKN